MIPEIEDHSPIEEIERVEKLYTARKFSAADQGVLSLGGLYTKVRRIVLQPDVESGQQQYASVPIGSIDGVSLIVAWPSDSEGLLPLKVHQQVSVKFFHELNLMMFTTQIHSLVFQPRPHIHLDWPREVSSVEVRDVRRVRVDLPASFTLEVSDQDAAPLPIIGKILDLTPQGAGFFSEQDKLAIGNKGRILMAIWPNPNEQPVQIRPQVKVMARNEIKRMNPPGWVYGLEFSELSSHERTIIWAVMGQAIEKKKD
jgi:Flagellar protein YcgR/PilZ domain